MSSVHDIIQLRGVAALSDAELLALLIDDCAEGSIERSEQLLSLFSGSLAGVARADLARLRMAAGVGLKRASRIAAAAELGRRMMALEADVSVQTITSTEDVVRLFRPKLAELQHEECWALFLTTSNRIIESFRVGQGGVQGTVVDQRLLIKRSLELLCSRIILLHNHPSGAAQPSMADKQLTQRVAEAAKLFDIELLDHIIISRNEFFSFRAEGLL